MKKNQNKEMQEKDVLGKLLEGTSLGTAEELDVTVSDHVCVIHKGQMTVCKRAVYMNDTTLMDYVTEAYPIVVFCKQLENKQRRMMEIQECEILPDCTRRFRPLFQYVITENRMEDGKFIIEGHHEQINTISESLAKRLLENGMPKQLIDTLRGEVLTA